MQLTNIEDQVIVRQSSIAFWSISIFVVIIDNIIATKVEDTAPFLILHNGYLVIGDRSNIDLAGFGIFTLSGLSNLSLHRSSGTNDSWTRPSC